MTVAASLFYGFLAMLLPQLPAQSPSRRRAIFAGAASAPLLMATSRVYLGVHYLIDVLASMLAGVMWLALSVALLRRLQRPRTEKLSAPA